MKATLVLISLFLISTLSLQAQQWSPERPGRTNSPYVLPVGEVSLEAGFRYERAEFKPYDPESFVNPGTIYSHDILVLPVGMARVGLGPTFELRLSSSYRRWDWAYDPNYYDGDEVADPVQRELDAGLQYLTVGIKSVLFEEKGLLPAVSLITALGLPHTGSGGFQVLYLAPDFSLVASHALSSRVRLTCNAGSRWDGFVATPIGYYTALVSVHFLERFDGFLEFYGDLPGHAPPLHYVNAGLTWSPDANLAIDAAFAYGLNSPGETSTTLDFSQLIATDLAVELGAAWRIELW
ncbi:transporter [bacterium]|nr:transporter [bacterium]